MKINKKKSISILLLFLFLFPMFVSAQSPIVPCGGYNTASTEMCTLCDLFQGIKNIIDYGRDIAIWVAVAMIVIAGIFYIVSAGNPGMMDTAKKLLYNVLIGFGLILLAWVIINTVIVWILRANFPDSIEKDNWVDIVVNCP